ncbi:MAG: UDP-N-acetylmuramoyl-L-alanyl-D-glutamate--2,6-diaminopimelate ligase [Polyangiaceae bacterium]|nr:UDP-N-acetylmuramoyl-L-alanyl-D-glutamate--2,6-diaminopimelate ligase [Polyangiaceae bacterium]
MPGIALSAVARASGCRVVGNDAVRITGIHHDSRHVERGDLFVARRGARVDGWRFVDEALARGACAILTEASRTPGEVPVPLLVAASVPEALAHAAAAIYGHPTRRLPVVGLTGTNGKTTTVSLVAEGLRQTGARPALMGTLGVVFDNVRFDPGLNTPEADELTRIAAQVLERGASHLIMEVTSHALSQRRADGIHFRVAAFTNLTHDHLDLHGSFEAYGEAKARLFTALSPDQSVIVVDGEFGAQLADGTAGPVLRVSSEPEGRADVRPIAVPVLDKTGIVATTTTPWGRVEIRSALIGAHNLANLLLALTIGGCLGTDLERYAAAIGKSAAPPGRLQRCDRPGDEIQVLVDYAHTPDALEQALRACRMITNGRIWCVFGCGGDRDRSKRSTMGAVAGDRADVVVVTSDNPRTEAPAAIAAPIAHAARRRRADLLVELDRARAIELAVHQASPGDLVLVAGKGHEDYQEVGTQRFAFDDRTHVRHALDTRALQGH